MPKFLSDRPTLRGFLIIGLIALVVVALNQYTALLAIAMLMRIAFFLAVAFFVYLMWRERRGEIESWSTRERVVFYGSDRAVLLARAAWVRAARVPGHPGRRGVRDVSRVARAAFLFLMRNA